MTLALIIGDSVPVLEVSIRGAIMYAAVVIGAGLTLFWRSEIALYLLTLLLPLQTTRYHLHAFPLGANMVDILLICCLVGGVIRPGTGLVHKPKVLIFLSFMAVFYYLSLWRGAFYLGGQLPLWFNNIRLVDYKNSMVMPLLTLATVLTLRTRRQFIAILVLCAAGSAIVDYSFLRSSTGRDLTHYSEDTRDAGPLGYAGENGLASYTVEITLCLLPLLALPQVKSIRFGLLALLAANTWCLLFSYSREAYLALVAGVLLITLIRIRILLIPLALLALTWQTILPAAVRERISMTYTHTEGDETAVLDPSAQERVQLWTDAMALIRQNPIPGSGYMTYASMGRVGSYRDTHNFYLKMLVETGFPGLVLFLVQLVLFYREGWRLFRRAGDPFLSLLGLGFAALIVGAAVVNFFGDRWLFIQVDSNLWILLGCVIAASSLVEHTDQAENTEVQVTQSRCLIQPPSYSPSFNPVRMPAISFLRAPRW